VSEVMISPRWYSAQVVDAVCNFESGYERFSGHAIYKKPLGKPMPNHIVQKFLGTKDVACFSDRRRRSVISDEEDYFTHDKHLTI
jgi:hypothetical protein